MAADGYKNLDVIINAETGKFATSDGYEQGTADLISLFDKGKFLLRMTYISNLLAAFPFEAGSTFVLAIDEGFVHTDDSGTLETNRPIGSYTTIPVVLSEDPPKQYGTLRLKNGTDDPEDFVFTSWINVSTTYTFTGISQALAANYVVGNEIDVLEPLMVRVEYDQFNIVGDWDDIDLPGGKICCRVICNTVEADEQLADQEIFQPYIECTKYTSGNQSPILQDQCNYKNIVNDDSPAPATSDPLYRTASIQASIDNTKVDKDLSAYTDKAALDGTEDFYIDDNGTPKKVTGQNLANFVSGKAILEAVNFKTVQQNTVYTVPSGKKFKPDIGDLLTDTITGAATPPTFKWLAGATELFPAYLATMAAVGEFESVKLEPGKYWPSGTVFYMEITSESTSTTHTGKAILQGVLIDE